MIKLRTPHIQRKGLRISFAASITLPLFCIYCEMVCFAKNQDTKIETFSAKVTKTLNSTGKTDLEVHIHKYSKYAVHHLSFLQTRKGFSQIVSKKTK